MTTVNSFFDMPEADVPRGVGGSPMLVPRGVQDIRAAYTRASYMSGFIEESEHFHRWEMRYLAKAMGQNEDLAALAAAETYSTGLSDAVYGRAKSASGKRLDEIIERALDRVRIHEKADRGTAIHGFTEPAWWDGSHKLEDIPERLRPAVGSFWETLRVNAAQLVGTEMFTANDTTMSAGTFDHLARFIGDPILTDFVVCDKKTGRFSPFEWAVQISTYAYGEPYDTSTDERPEWPGPINKQWGCVFHIDADAGTTKLVVVDLEFGWEMAQLAAKVRDAHERRDIAAPHRPATFAQRLAAAETQEDLRLVWSSTTDPSQQREVEQKAGAL